MASKRGAKRKSNNSRNKVNTSQSRPVFSTKARGNNSRKVKKGSLDIGTPRTEPQEDDLIFKDAPSNEKEGDEVQLDEDIEPLGNDNMEDISGNEESPKMIGCLLKVQEIVIRQEEK